MSAKNAGYGKDTTPTPTPLAPFSFLAGIGDPDAPVCGPDGCFPPRPVRDPAGTPEPADTDGDDLPAGAAERG